MGITELLLLSLGLAMDAFSVSVCKGLSMKRIDYRGAAVIALFFGGFQAAMPLLGYFLGSRFEAYISRYSHWVAFILLGFIGGKMAVAGDYLMLPVRSSVKKYAQNFVAKDTYIRFSKLGTEAAPVGAALLSRSRLLKVDF